jgi:hypothetical protein
MSGRSLAISRRRVVLGPGGQGAAAGGAALVEVEAISRGGNGPAVERREARQWLVVAHQLLEPPLPRWG